MRFKVEIEREGGWSRWVPPVMTGYKMSCCDCHLVHDMEFKAVRVTKENADGSWTYEELNPEKYRIVFRAKRNKRSTAAMRRKKK